MADSESALVEEKREGRRFWVLVRRVEGRREASVCCQNPPCPLVSFALSLSPRPVLSRFCVPVSRGCREQSGAERAGNARPPFKWVCWHSEFACWTGEDGGLESCILTKRVLSTILTGP